MGKEIKSCMFPKCLKQRTVLQCSMPCTQTTISTAFILGTFSKYKGICQFLVMHVATRVLHLERDKTWLNLSD